MLTATDTLTKEISIFDRHHKSDDVNFDEPVAYQEGYEAPSGWG